MATPDNNRRKRIPIVLAGSVFTRGLQKAPQENVAKSEPIKPRCPHGYEAQETDWHAEGKFYRVLKCFKCFAPKCLHGQHLTDEDIKFGVKQSSECRVCFPPIFSTSVKVWDAALSKAGFGKGRGMSMVEEVKPLADGSVKISGYSKNLCTGGGSKDMDTADADAQLGGKDDVGHKGEADFDESIWVDDLNEPISSKSESAAHSEELSNSVIEAPTLKYEIIKIAKGRYRVLENGQLIREYTTRAAAAHFVKQVKAEISEEKKHETQIRQFDLQQITETDGAYDKCRPLF
jgi:hypothetical protein